MNIEDEPFLQHAAWIAYHVEQAISEFGFHGDKRKDFLRLIDSIQDNYTFKHTTRGCEIVPKRRLVEKILAQKYSVAAQDLHFQAFKAILLPVAQPKRDQRRVRNGGAA